MSKFLDELIDLMKRRAARGEYERSVAMRPYHEERRRIRNRQLERESRHLLGRREAEDRQ